MTQLTIHEAVGTVHIKIDGHAGYNPGNDIVCAAISTMCYAFINQLEAMYSREELEDLQIIDEAGHIEIRLKKDMSRTGRQYWNATRDYFITGMEMIAEQFPDYLEVEG